MRTTVLLELWRVSRRAGVRLDEALADTPLNGADFGLYSVLRYRGPITPTALSQLAGSPATTTSHALARLERHGHLDRRANPQDARSQLVSLSPRGQAAHEAAAEAFVPFLQDVVGDLGADHDVVVWGLGRLDRALGAEDGWDPPDGDDRSVPTPQPLRYSGAALTRGQEDEVRRFIDWVRDRDESDDRTVVAGP